MLDSGSTMEMIQFVFGIILIASFGFFVWKFIFERFRMANLSKEALYFDKIRIIYNPLKKNKTPKSDKLEKYAKNIKIRVLLFELLELYDRTDLFPRAFITKEKASESYLVNWLNEHENYDNYPDEIQLVDIPELRPQVWVYKVKNHERYIQDNKEWLFVYMVYKTEQGPYQKPDIIESDFDDKMLPVEELKQRCVL